MKLWLVWLAGIALVLLIIRGLSERFGQPGLTLIVVLALLLLLLISWFTNKWQTN